MKYGITAFLFLFLISSHSFGQTRKPYHTSCAELIFSYGVVENSQGGNFTSALRFSGFWHTQYTFHFDFGKAAGFYTGLGLRNVGLITHPAAGVKVKQRAYGLGVPLAFKFGNMDTRKYFAIGAEAEYFFNYKQKFFINGKKTKSNEWFSDRVTPFNPSVFVEFEDKSLFIRAKYYLLDFLKPQDNLQLNETTLIPGYSKSSMLFYISVGLNIKGSKKDTNKIVKPNKSA